MTDAEWAYLKQIMAALFWKLYEENKEQQFSIKFWFISKTFKIKDLQFLFEFFFGKPPVVT